MKSALAAGASLAVAAGTWFFLAGTRAPAAPRPEPATRAAAPAGHTSADLAPGRAGSPLPARSPPVARDAGPSFHRVFRIGADGALLVDEVARECIDTLLAETPAGEEADARIRQGLTEAPARQAGALLATYRAYLQAQAELLGAPRQREDLASALALEERLAALRRFHLGEAVALAFFGAQERRTRAVIEALKAQAQEGG